MKWESVRKHNLSSCWIFICQTKATNYEGMLFLRGPFNDIPLIMLGIICCCKFLHVWKRTQPDIDQICLAKVMNQQKLGLGVMCYGVLNFLTIPRSKYSPSSQLLRSAVQTDNEIVLESSKEMNHCCMSLTLRLTKIQRWQIFSSKNMNSRHLWKSESVSKREHADQCRVNFVK